VSPAGERWSATARQQKTGIEFETVVLGQSDTGGFIDLSSHRLRGNCRVVVARADYDSGFQETAGPVDVSVVLLDLALSDGTRVRVVPKVLRSRTAHRWLRGLRWLSVFLAPGTEIIGAKAFNRRGHVVTRLRPRRGELLCRKGSHRTLKMDGTP
jgi:hypothetical protein